MSWKARIVGAGFVVALVGVIAVLMQMRSLEHTPWAELGRSADSLRPDDSFRLASAERDPTSCGTSECDTRRLNRFYVSERDPASTCDATIARLRNDDDAIDVKTAKPNELNAGQSCYADAIFEGRYLTVSVFTSDEQSPGNGTPPGLTVLSVNVFE